MDKGITFGLFSDLFDRVDLALLSSRAASVNAPSTEETNRGLFGVAVITFHTYSVSVSRVDTEAKRGNDVACVSSRLYECATSIHRLHIGCS